MNRHAFRDIYEDQAYAVICQVKYGGYGGLVETNLIRKCGDILRGRSLDPPKIKVALPQPVSTITLPGTGAVVPVLPFVNQAPHAAAPINISVPMVAAAVALPTIKLP